MLITRHNNQIMLLYILTPRPCVHCNKLIFAKNRICKNCQQNITSYDFSECIYCRLLCINGQSHFYCQKINEQRLPTNVIYTYLYQDVTKSIIIHSKSKKCEHSLLKILFDLKPFKSDINSIKKLKIDLVIPIPLNSKKTSKRLANHSLIIAQQVAKIIKCKIKSDVFYYLYFYDQKHRDRQARLNATNRLGLSKKYQNKIKGKHILIVDDVITSGKTIYDATTLLKQYECKKVFAYALARPIMYNNSINYGNI